MRINLASSEPPQTAFGGMVFEWRWGMGPEHESSNLLADAARALLGGVLGALIGVLLANARRKLTILAAIGAAGATAAFTLLHEIRLEGALRVEDYFYTYGLIIGIGLGVLAAMVYAVFVEPHSLLD